MYLSFRSLASRALVVASWAAAGCGSDDAAGSASALSAGAVQSFEGLYALQAFSRNESGCDAPGASLFETEDERRFVLVGASALGVRYISLVSCLDDADCSAKVEAIRAPRGYSGHYTLTLSEENTADELAGLSASSGFLEGDSCTDREFTDHRLRREGNLVTIESRRTPLGDAPAEDGICWARPAEQRQEAAGLPCAELQIISGTRLGALP